MKPITAFALGVSVGIFGMFIVICFAKPIPKNVVMLSKTFGVDGKEFQCGYTPRQVEINLLEDRIQKLKQ